MLNAAESLENRIIILQNSDSDDVKEEELPLGEVAKMTQIGKVPRRRVSREQGNSKPDQAPVDTGGRTDGTSKEFKREHKHRPVEMSSKKPVPVYREVMQGNRRHVRDPRFDSLGGQYSEKAFKKRYSFVYDEALPAEKRDIKQALEKTKSTRKKEKLKQKLQRITQQLKTEEARRKQETRREKVMEKVRDKNKSNSSKFYLKKSELKKQELLLKYQELKESGHLEKYMEKRRKRNAAKDHRYLPARKAAS